MCMYVCIYIYIYIYTYQYETNSYHNTIARIKQTNNSYIGIITDLSQVCLMIYDTETFPYNYTGSENIDITDNQTSLNFPLK